MHMHFPGMTGVRVLVPPQHLRGMPVIAVFLALAMVVRMGVLMRVAVTMDMTMLVRMLRPVLVGMGMAVLVTVRMLVIMPVLVVALHRLFSLVSAELATIDIGRDGRFFRDLA
jgi:hypothetical protein